jgi:hypothetical protein
VASGDGLLIVDHAASRRPLGVEITTPQAVPLDRLNQLPAELGEPPFAEQNDRPARPHSCERSARSISKEPIMNRVLIAVVVIVFLGLVVAGARRRAEG